NSDEGRSVQQTQDGGYIICGYTRSYGAGYNDIYLIKTDENGNQLWYKTFGGSLFDEGYSVQQTNDGGYIMTGYVGFEQLCLIKTDANGNQVWLKTFGGSGVDWGYSVQQTQDGGYIIAGRTTSFGAGYYDVYIIKTDADGNQLWYKTFGGSNYDDGRSIQQTQDGGYIIAGSTLPPDSSNSRVYLIKTDSDGNLLWYKTFSGIRAAEGRSVQQTQDGGYIIAGTTYIQDQQYYLYLIKADADGNQVWYKTYSGLAHAQGYSVRQTRDGGYIIAGVTAISPPAVTGSAYLIKTDADGNQVWYKILGGSNTGSVGYSVQQTQDRGYIMAGSFTSTIWDVYLVKLSPSVEVEEDMPQFSFISLDRTTLLCGQSVMIKYQLPVKSSVKLSIYDLTGRLVGMLFEGIEETGYHSVRWNTNGMCSGIYFIKFSVNNYYEVKKIVLIK
ncbi:MAG: T9SS type A sorting domain-containing protein, partial [candidate division WOR-3 bacterium]